MRKNAAFLLILMLVLPLVLTAQSKERRATRTTVNRPERVAYRQDLVNRLKAPPGFQVSIFATGAGEPRMMAVGPDGAVYVTRPDRNDVIVLRDKNGDGKADENKSVINGIKSVHGINIRDNKLYLAGVNEIFVANLDGTNLKKLAGDLPDGGRHGNRTIDFDKNGMLYVSIGSTCNACDETNPEHATILRMKPDGQERKVFAKGLRNTIGFDWHPETGELWGMDHGSDDRGDHIPPEELNLLKEGADYGWPYCYDQKKADPAMKRPEKTTKEAYCSKTHGPALTYTAHAAPIEMLFYRGKQFPAEFQGDAFVAMHGSWNRSTPVGYKVVRIEFENGKPKKFDDFLTGFLLEGGNRQFGRPAGLAIMKDGSLLISDDENGVIYRVSYSPRTAKK